MSINEVHVGDVGTVFTFTVKDSGTALDISAATTTNNLILKKASGTATTLSAAFVTDGTDGKIKYTSTSGIFEEMGTHKFQAIIDDGTNLWRTDIYTFNVFANIA